MSDLLNDNQGSHQESGESESNDDSTDNKHWRESMIAQGLGDGWGLTSISVDTWYTGDRTNDSTDNKTITVD